MFLPFEVETILNIPISYHVQDDQLIWVGNKSEIFTVKSTYYVARKILVGCDRGESSTGDTQALLWKKMWHLNIPAKVRNFAWRLCTDAIPTMLNINKRGIQVGLCMDRVGSDWGDFLTPPIMVGQKKFNLTQPTWVRLNPWVWQILLLLLLNWVEKNININILKKPKD